MAKIKKHYQKRYTVTDNKLIEDERLSWKARGIFTYLWAQSDDWIFYETEVMKHSIDGRASLRSGLKELEEYGYLKRSRSRTKKGILGDPVWDLSDKPMFDYPKLDNPTFDKPTLDNRTLTSTNKTNTNNNKYELEAAAGGKTLQDVANHFQKNICVMNGKNVEDLRVWSEDLPIDVLYKAVDVAADSNAKSFSYVNSILKRWYSQNLNTIEKVEADLNNRNKSNKSNNKRGVESEEYGW